MSDQTFLFTLAGICALIGLPALIYGLTGDERRANLLIAGFPLTMLALLISLPALAM